ncbi:MAG: hypothetical protein R2770_19055 [Acidimicrobiales bacterium]|nr:hypothetical protein [Acidimicrobiales bacterium]
MSSLVARFSESLSDSEMRRILEFWLQSRFAAGYPQVYLYPAHGTGRPASADRAIDRAIKIWRQNPDGLSLSPYPVEQDPTSLISISDAGTRNVEVSMPDLKDIDPATENEHVREMFNLLATVKTQWVCWTKAWDRVPFSALGYEFRGLGPDEVDRYGPLAYYSAHLTKLLNQEALARLHEGGLASTNADGSTIIDCGDLHPDHKTLELVFRTVEPLLRRMPDHTPHRDALPRAAVLGTTHVREAIEAAKQHLAVADPPTGRTYRVLTKLVASWEKELDGQPDQ